MEQPFFNEREKILALEPRRKLYNIVKKFAGCHFRELKRKSGLPLGSVRYHLGYLTRHGLIEEKKEGNNLRYFPVGLASLDAKLLGLLRQTSIRKIVLFILTHKNCNHEQIVEAVQLSPSTITWHLKKLEANGIIVSRKKGRKTSYGLVVDQEQIVKLLIAYKESFFDSLVNRVIEMWG